MTKVIPKEKRLAALAHGTLMGFFCIAIIDFLSVLVSTGSNAGTDTGFVVMFGFYYVIIGLPIAFILCFILGIPTFLIFNRFRKFNLSAAIAMGLFMGSVFGLINFTLFSGDFPLWFTIFDLFSTIVVGAFAGHWSFQRTSTEIISLRDFD